MTILEIRLSLGLLCFIAGLLTLSVGRTLIRSGGASATEQVRRAMEDTIEQFGEATKHFVEVNSVLGLLDELQKRPYLVPHVSAYCREVMAAALLTRVNRLGRDIQANQDAMSGVNQQISRSHYRETEIRRLQFQMTALMDELTVAQRAVEEFAAPEPLPTSHVLYSLPNCIILPHIASASIETRHKMGQLAVDNLLAGLLDKRLPQQA